MLHEYWEILVGVNMNNRVVGYEGYNMAVFHLRLTMFSHRYSSIIVPFFLVQYNFLRTSVKILCVRRNMIPLSFILSALSLSLWKMHFLVLQPAAFRRSFEHLAMYFQKLDRFNPKVVSLFNYPDPPPQCPKYYKAYQENEKLLSCVRISVLARFFLLLNCILNYVIISGGLSD